MIRVIKQYGISILLLIVAIFCFFNISKNIEDAFTVITNSLAIFLAIFYFVNFEQDIIIKIKSFVLNIKWPFHGKSKKILNNLLNFIIEKRWDIISYLFIFLLLIITLGQFSYLERFINLSWISTYQAIITVLAILSGGLTFWHNRERVEKESEEELNKEELSEKKRKEEFPNKFPRINKIPVLRNIVKWMYKEGWWYSIGLISTILSFIHFKIPFLFQEFIDKHIQKYAATLEPVRTMLENNNPFIIQRMYQGNPITNPEGIFESISNIPLLEWLLYFVAKLLPFLNFTLTIRATMAFFGVIMIISLFYFGKKIHSKLFGLILALFIFSNYIFNLIYHVTVYDGILFIFFCLISGFLLQRMNWKRIIISGFLSGLIAGIKYSFLIYIYPLILFLIFFDKNKKIKEKLFLFVSYSIMIVAVPLINVACDFLKITLLTKLILIALIGLLILLILKFENKIFTIFKKISAKNYIISTLIGTPLAFYILVYKLKIATPEIFLTDTKLLFNYNMYKQIFTWLQGFIPFNITWIIIVFFIITLLELISAKGRYKKHNIFIIGMLLTSIIYLVIASKTIFFHAYYLFFFVLTNYILLTYNIIKIRGIISKKIFIILLLFIVFMSFSYQNKQSARLLSQTKTDLLNVANYINDNFETNEIIFINHNELSILSLYTNRPTFEYYKLTDSVTKKEITEKGFSNFMNSIGVNYYIVYNDINYYHLGLFYHEEEIEKITRTEAILHRTGNKRLYTNNNFQEIIDLGVNKASPYLFLQEEFGNYKIFKIISL